ncbi:hypothetical protein IAU60_003731 [Kwoniella sp. DSM 27419]
MSTHNILVLGATGTSALIGPADLQAHPATKSKLPQDLLNTYADRVTVVEGGLTDEKALDAAMKGVTSVVSFLGAYMSLTYLITRATPTPIAESMHVVKSVMQRHGVKRLLALSTPAHSMPGEMYSWAQWFTTQVFPPAIVPQGSAEMTAIAEVCADPAFDYTIFRVPHLTNGPADAQVFAGLYNPEFKGTQQLSRASMARWVYQEIKKGEWIGQQPALGNY